MLLSICVTTYNRPHFLLQLMKSIEEIEDQYSNEVELILLDNGSDLETQELIEQINSKIEIKKIRNNENFRGNKILLQHISSASGEFVIFPGDDDYFANQGLSNIVRTLKTMNKNYNLIAFGCEVIYENTDREAFHFIPKGYESKKELFIDLLLENRFYLPSTVARRSAIDYELLPKSPTVLDWMLWINLGLKGMVLTNPQEVITYRVHRKRDQESYEKEFWELDKAQAFIDSISKGVIFNWLETQSPNDIEEVLVGLSIEVEKRIPDFAEKLVLIHFIGTCLKLFDLDHGIARRTLVSARIDPRLAAVITSSIPGNDDFNLALRFVSEGSISFLPHEDLEKLYSEAVYTKKLKPLKIEFTEIGLIEAKIISIYRYIRNVALRIPLLSRAFKHFRRDSNLA